MLTAKMLYLYLERLRVHMEVSIFYIKGDIYLKFIFCVALYVYTSLKFQYPMHTYASFSCTFYNILYYEDKEIVFP